MTAQGIEAELQSVTSLLPHLGDQGATVEARLQTDLLQGVQVEVQAVAEAGVLILMIIQEIPKGMVLHISRLVCFWKKCFGIILIPSL